MSHTVAVKTQVKDAAALATTCDRLGIPYVAGKQSVELYNDNVACDFSLKLPGWQYPVAVNLETGEVKFDNYNGSWGKIEQFEIFHQEYGLTVVENEPAIQELLNAGWQVERVQAPNLDVKLRVYR